MTEEQQRIAIAEACGWTEISQRCMWGLPPNTIDCGMENCLRHFPYYTSDLNAMHEAMLLHPRKALLRSFLYLEVLDDPTNTANEPAWATAKQWALAYVKSIGKWEP